MRSRWKLKWIRLNFRVNDLEFEEVLMRPRDEHPGDQQADRLGSQDDSKVYASGGVAPEYGPRSPQPSKLVPARQPFRHSLPLLFRGSIQRRFPAQGASCWEALTLPG